MESSLRRWSFGRLLRLWCVCALCAFGLIVLLDAVRTGDVLFSDNTVVGLLVTTVAALITPSIVTARWCAAGAHRSWHGGQLALVWVVIGGIAMMVYHAGDSDDGGWLLVLFVALPAINALHATWTWFGSRTDDGGGAELGAHAGSPPGTTASAVGSATSKSGPEEKRQGSRVRRSRFLAVLIVGWLAVLAYLTLGPSAAWRVRRAVRADLDRLGAVQYARAAANAPYLVLGAGTPASSPTDSVSIGIEALFDRFHETPSSPPRVMSSTCHLDKCAFTPTPGMKVSSWASSNGWRWGATVRDARDIVECTVTEDREPGAPRYGSGRISCSLVE